MNILFLHLKKKLKALKVKMIALKPVFLNIGFFILGAISFYIVSYIVHLDQKVINIPNEPSVHTDASDEINGTLQSCDLYIDINGAVNYPGVYCLNNGSRLIDAVNKAKGFNKLYAQKYVEQKFNLASLLEENQKIYIPYFNDQVCENKTFSYEVDNTGNSLSNNGTQNNSSSACVSINEGTLEQLKTLKGIGDSIGQKIIDGRPYKSINDLNNVSGIGDSIFNNIKSLVCL